MHVSVTRLGLGVLSALLLLPALGSAQTDSTDRVNLLRAPAPPSQWSKPEPKPRRNEPKAFDVKPAVGKRAASKSAKVRQTTETNITPVLRSIPTRVEASNDSAAPYQTHTAKKDQEDPMAPPPLPASIRNVLPPPLIWIKEPEPSKRTSVPAPLPELTDEPKHLEAPESNAAPREVITNAVRRPVLSERKPIPVQHTQKQPPRVIVPVRKRTISPAPSVPGWPPAFQSGTPRPAHRPSPQTFPQSSPRPIQNRPAHNERSVPKQPAEFDLKSLRDGVRRALGLQRAKDVIVQPLDDGRVLVKVRANTMDEAVSLSQQLLAIPEFRSPKVLLGMDVKPPRVGR